MGARLLQHEDDKREEIASKVGELDEKFDAFTNESRQARGEMREEISETEQDVLQRVATLHERFVPRRELETKLDNIRLQQNNNTKVMESVARGVSDIQNSLAPPPPTHSPGGTPRQSQ